MLNNIKDFFKKFWGLFATGFGIIFGMIIFRKKVDSYENITKKLQDSHQKQLDEIEIARKEEKQELEENEKEYRKKIVFIEKEYKTAKIKLDEKKRKEIEVIVKTYGNQPEKLAQRLTHVMGFKIIMPKED